MCIICTKISEGIVPQKMEENMSDIAKILKKDNLMFSRERLGKIFVQCIDSAKTITAIVRGRRGKKNDYM